MARSRKPITPESPVPENLSRGQRAAILEARRADPRRLITRTLEQTGQRHGMRQVWEDWIEALALVFANALGNGFEDRRDDAWHAREARYLQIVKRYDADEWAAISDLLGPLSLAAELEGDILGELYMTLDFGNERAGQFFTPWHLCALNARLLVGDGEALRAELVANAGHVKVDDPACGSGTMLLAYAAAARELGFNPQTQMWFHGTDISSSAAHMAYVNLALRGLPGIIVHGDTLRLTCFGTWTTPQHDLGGWSARIDPRTPKFIVALLSLADIASRSGDAPTSSPDDAPPAPEVDGPADVVPAAPPIDHPGLPISITPLDADPPRSETVDRHPAADPEMAGGNADKALTPAPPPAPAETPAERAVDPPGQLSLL